MNTASFLRFACQPVRRSAPGVFKIFTLAAALLASTGFAHSKDLDWSLGAYTGKYYDSEPAGFLKGDANFKEQYIVALNGSKTVWHSATLPLSIEIDAVLAQQSGLASLTEVALAPVVRWGGFPWNHLVQTDLRLAPLGVSYTSEVGPLERGPGGQGSNFLNFLMIEAAFSSPHNPADELFMRLHHRCAVYDLLNNYGANGQDFFAVGYRKRF
jgi:hypothetical protein